MMQFTSFNDNVYSLFRYDEKKVVGLLINPTDKKINVVTSKYDELVEDQEFYFQELTSCLEYSNALNAQSVGKINELLSNNRFFSTYCAIREIPQSDAGTKILFRDPKKPE